MSRSSKHVGASYKHIVEYMIASWTVPGIKVSLTMLLPKRKVAISMTTRMVSLKSTIISLKAFAALKTQDSDQAGE